jgi:hypothetical protein
MKEKEFAIIFDVDYMSDEFQAASIFSSIYCEFRLHRYILENRYFIKKTTKDVVYSDIKDIIKNLCQIHGKEKIDVFIKNISIIDKKILKNIKSEFL